MSRTCRKTISTGWVTARADATGDAFTFVAPDEEGDLSQIERAIGKRLPRVMVQGFDYASKPAQRFEVPIAERIAEIRARKADDRIRAKANVARREAAERQRNFDQAKGTVPGRNPDRGRSGRGPTRGGPGGGRPR